MGVDIVFLQVVLVEVIVCQNVDIVFGVCFIGKNWFINGLMCWWQCGINFIVLGYFVDCWYFNVGGVVMLSLLWNMVMLGVFDIECIYFVKIVYGVVIDVVNYYVVFE